VRGAQNLFDFVVVAVSLVSILLQNAPGFNILRLLRVFRVPPPVP
jgi:hypothetical protein